MNVQYRHLLTGALAGAFACLPAPAHADPISAAILTFIGIEATATAIAVTTFVLGVAASVSLSLVARLFTPTTPASATTSATGTQANVQYGAAVPRDRIFGIAATAGQFLYWNLSGPDNLQLDLVFAVGDGPHDSLAGLYVNGIACTFGGVESTGTVVNEFTRPSDGTHTMWVQFHQGFEGQTADAVLVASSNPAGRWTSASTLSGISYVRVTMNYEKDVYSSGIPNFLFVVKGALLYDMRFDSTNGGSGSQRWATPSTWVWSDNPSIGLYNYQRGLYLNGELIIGEGLSPQEMIAGMYAAAANDCDGAVALLAGGTEKRYRVNMNVGSDKTYATVIQQFLDAMAGELVESAGAFGPTAGITQTVALPVILDTDLFQGKPLTFAKKRSRADLINAVFGSYTEPNQQYSMIPFAPRTSTADETADGGGRIALQIDYPQIQSQTQAQRVGEITRRLSRAEGTATITVGFKFAVAETGDWVEWNSARYGDITWRIDGVTINEDESVTLVLREISSSVFAWNNGVDELNPTSPGNLPGFGGLATTVSSFNLAAAQINGAGGLTIPAIRCLWTPITDQSIIEVVIQYRIQQLPLNDGIIKWVSFGAPAPATGEGLITEGIQAGTTYEARATITTRPNRATTYTSWTVQAAPLLHVVPSALSATLAAEYRYQVTTIMDYLNDKIDQINQTIASLASNDLATNWLDKQRLRSELKSVSDTAQASIVTLQTAQTSADAALAQYQLTVTASFGNVSSSIATNALAISTANSAFATYQTTVTATLAGITASVTTNSTAISTLNGYAAAQYSVTLDVNGYASGFNLLNGGGGISTATFLVSKFQIASPGVTGGAPVPIFTVANVSGSPKIGIRADMFVDGTLTATMIQAATITAAQIAANTITSASGVIGALSVDSLSIADNAVTVPVAQSGSSAVLGTNSAITIFSFNFVVDTTGLTGKTIVIYFSVHAEMSFAATNTNWVTQLSITGIGLVSQNSGFNGDGTTQMGTYSFTASGGVQTFPVVFTWNSANTATLNARTIFATCGKR